MPKMTNNVNPKKPETIREKNYPAGRGHFLKIIEGLLPTYKTKTKPKGFKLLDMFPINITYYAPNDSIVLFSGRQWKKLANEDIDKLLATLIYIKALNLHKIPCFCTRNVYASHKGPQMRIRKEVLKEIQTLHTKTSKWAEKKWKK